MLTAFLKGLNAQIHKQMSTDKFFRCEITLRDVYCTVSFNTERSDYGFILCKVHTEAEFLGGGQLYRGTCTLGKLQALFLSKLSSFLKGEKQSLNVGNLPDFVVKKTHATYMNKIKGRGVFANVNIKKGEIIEICPVLVLSPAESFYLMCTTKGMLVDYVYPWEFPKKAMPLGNGILYNCNRMDPDNEDNIVKVNAEAHLFPKRQQVMIKALEDIPFGEEIIIDYWGMEGPESLDSDAYWKDVQKEVYEQDSFVDPMRAFKDALKGLLK